MNCAGLSVGHIQQHSEATLGGLMNYEVWGSGFPQLGMEKLKKLVWSSVISPDVYGHY